MAKEILLYTSINSYSVSDFINSLEANKDGDIVVRMNTPGGSVYDGFGAIAKYNEFPNSKSIKVDGRADSFGAYFVAATDPNMVECLDVSSFTFHRAAMPSWFEADANYFTEDVKASLNAINTTLRGFIESKVTAPKWKSVTGTSLDDMFSLDARVDVTLDAKQMKSLGMVGTVNKITPKKLAEIKAYSADLAAEYAPLVEAETITTNKSNKMTIQEVKANAELWASIKGEVLADEKDRVDAFAAFAEIDAKGVLDAIVGGDKFTQAFGAKMQVKAMSKEGLKNIAEANAGETNVGEQTGASTEATEFEAHKAQILAMAKKQAN